MLAKRGSTNPAGRVGDPAEFGDACAFLCAASSGFIVGQNLLLGRRRLQFDDGMSSHGCFANGS